MKLVLKVCGAGPTYAMPAEERLWIIAARRPSKALEQLAGSIARDWPTGTYRLAEGFRTYVIAVNELPVIRDTLLLRVLGAGNVLRTALAEVGALPYDAPERGILISTVLRLKRDTQSAELHTATDEEFLMTTQDLVQEWERDLLERGREEGRLQERAEDVLRVLAARKVSVSKRERKRIVACKDLERLGHWLERAATAASTADIFGA